MQHTMTDTVSDVLNKAKQRDIDVLKEVTSWSWEGTSKSVGLIAMRSRTKLSLTRRSLAWLRDNSLVSLQPVHHPDCNQVLGCAYRRTFTGEAVLEAVNERGH